MEELLAKLLVQALLVLVELAVMQLLQRMRNPAPAASAMAVI